MDQALTKQKIKELRALVGDGDRVAIVLQDDPDPDAMSSGIALRALLGRNKQTTPLFAFKPVTRPENLTMVHMLEIEIQTATTEDLRAFDKIAMVDVQPPFFGEKIPRADIVDRSSSRISRRRRSVRGRAHEVRRDCDDYDRVPDHG